MNKNNNYSQIAFKNRFKERNNRIIYKLKNNEKEREDKLNEELIKGKKIIKFKIRVFK